jgi:hypothetical protein
MVDLLTLACMFSVRCAPTLIVFCLVRTIISDSLLVSNRQRANADSTSTDTDDSRPLANPPNTSRTTTETESTETNDGEDEAFDPDERQLRVLLRQNLAHLDAETSIDFDKLTRELDLIDRNRGGLLNRQQIEEAVYKVRVPLQRTLTFQILEKHCRASPGIYR